MVMVIVKMNILWSNFQDNVSFAILIQCCNVGLLGEISTLAGPGLNFEHLVKNLPWQW